MFLLAIALTALWARATAGASCTYPTLYSATLEDLTSGLESGCYTSVDLVKTYLARIDEVNDELNVIIELNPDALSIAAALDAERKSGSTRGPLHGIPMLVKDNIATYDKLNNTAGSYSLVGANVPRDSGVVAKLRAGGAIILGKANLSQWAMFRSSNSTNGWSSRGGQTYGGFYPKMDPYGSSSGSAVAAALGLTFASLGTETRGSILQPANKGNIVGIKPSLGLTSRSLVIPITVHQDTVGPLARTVRDAATVLSVIAGYDEYDNFTSAIPNGGKLPDYVAATTKYSDLTGVRIGVAWNGMDDELLLGNVNRSAVMAAFNETLDVLRGLGAEIVDPANFLNATHYEYDVGYSNPRTTYQGTVCSAGFISDLASYLSELTSNPNGIHSVEDLHDYTTKDPREDYPDRDTISWDGALSLGLNSSDKRAWDAWQASVKLDIEGGVTGVCNLLNLSAIVMPTEYSPSWASSPGLPAISVPMSAYPDDIPIQKGLRELIAVAPRIPLGLTFLGRRWSEETLIGLAAAYERANDFRHKYELGPEVTMPTTEIVDIIANKTCGNSSATATGTTALGPTMPVSPGTMLRVDLLRFAVTVAALAALLN